MNVKPNVSCVVSASNGHDVYGATTFSVGKPAKCLVVKFISKTDREIVRVDAGASRGNGKELKADVVLLFDFKTKIAQGDKVEMLGSVLQVANVHPRFSNQGKVDHNEVELMIWQSE